MDEDGFCRFASPANVAQRAVVSLEEATAAISKLESPDPNSSDPDNEGRRIERVPGGWIVLNAIKYKQLATREAIRESTRKRVAAHRAWKKGNDIVTPRNGRVTQEKRGVTQSETETETTPPLPPLGETGAAAQALEITSTEAAQALVVMMGMSGYQHRLAAKGACEAVKRRKPELRYTAVPEFIQCLWREYDAQPRHGKVSLKTFLGEIGRFLDSDSWRVPAARAGPAVDEHGGHFEGSVYVTKDGVRMPGYTPPPKPKAKGAGV